MKNGILICALVAVAIMTVGLFLYEYVPNGLTVSKANTYEVTSETTEVLNDAGKAEELLSKQDSQTSSTARFNWDSSNKYYSKRIQYFKI